MKTGAVSSLRGVTLVLGGSTETTGGVKADTVEVGDAERDVLLRSLISHREMLESVATVRILDELMPEEVGDEKLQRILQERRTATALIERLSGGYTGN